MNLETRDFDIKKCPGIVQRGEKSASGNLVQSSNSEPPMLDIQISNQYQKAADGSVLLDGRQCVCYGRYRNMPSKVCMEHVRVGPKVTWNNVSGRCDMPKN